MGKTFGSTGSANKLKTEVTVSNQTAAKIGLFGAMSVIIGGIVGIGIFFKNGSVFRNNDGNGIGVILSWAIAFIIAICTAIAFSEIVTCRTKTKNAGLAGWAERFVGYRMGRLVKIMMPLFYYSTYILIDSIFVSEAIFNCVAPESEVGIVQHMGLIVLVGMIMVIFFMGMNFAAAKASQKFSQITTLLKFIPLATVILAGVIFGSMNPEHNLFIHPGNTFNPEGKGEGNFSFLGILSSLPAIMFAFDSFLVIGNIAGNVKNPEKNVSLSMVLSMAISGFIYLIITIAQIMIGCGSAYEVFQYIFASNETAKNAFTYIISIFIIIAVLGVTNAVTMGGVRSMQAAIDEEVIFGSKWLKKVGNGKENLSGAIMCLIAMVFYMIIFGIPSIVLNTDQIFDGASNLTVLFFFVIYGIVAIASAFNRKTNRVTEIRKQKGQVPIAIIGAIGCFVAVGYCLFYQFGFGNIGKDLSESFTAWGLFKYKGHELSTLVAIIIFWLIGLLFITMPFINDLLIKLTGNKSNQVLIWQKLNNSQVSL